MGLLIGTLAGWLLDLAFFRRVTQPGKRITMFLVFILVEPLLVFYFVAPIMAAYVAVHTTHHPVTLPASSLAEDAIEVAFTTTDNIPISGWYAPPKNGIVIIALHGLNRNRLDVLAPAKALVENDFGVLLLDMRGHGNSGGEIYSSCLAKEDVAAAVRYIQEREPDAVIGAYGLSSGAHTALCAAANIPEIHAVFADGVTFGRVKDILVPRAQTFKSYNLLVPAYWTLTVSQDLFSGYKEPLIQDLVKGIFPRPLLFVAAENDMLEPDQARRYFAFVCSLSSTWVAPGVSHGGAFAAYSEEYTQRMVKFFTENAHSITDFE
jgi:pimeloyl-ACP methyl ester carboxylesterase